MMKENDAERAMNVMKDCIEKNDRMQFSLSEGSPLYNACGTAMEALSREIPDTWIIQHESGTIYYEHDTQNCLCSYKVPYSYCPHCGQKMKL